MREIRTSLPDQITYNALKDELDLRLKKNRRSIRLSFIRTSMLEAIVAEQNSIDTSVPLKVLKSKNGEFDGLQETPFKSNSLR